ncbi:mitochondrial carrier domain-containing protein [Dactylonectria estremocensis]|uniref:Mitochondrial carrier domain-containing protein n=1 Tax=Dactylonectria estremocensis TaxID=1079267 RepID=A0A9P9FDR9_9HYPO|nr:mitochondrial carrier domain-containing protein [Dactylonectria estremocensis]
MSDHSQIPMRAHLSGPKTTGATGPKLTQYPKWFGGSASCLAVVCSHPLDLVKVRLQATPPSERKNVLETVLQILRSEGASGLYRGLSAGLLRQLTYGSTRFAIYESIKQQSARRNNEPVPMSILLAGSTFSGTCGALVGNPADIANVRMQNDRSLPAQQRQNYTTVFDVLARIAKQDGLRGYFRGVLPNCIRAGAMTGCQLSCYDGIKEALIANTELEDRMPTQLLASLLAGLIATTVCSPIDVIKTRTMSHQGRTSILGMATQLTRSEGMRWAFRGWAPSFARLGPHTAVTLLLLEQHRSLYRWYLDT